MIRSSNSSSVGVLVSVLNISSSGASMLSGVGKISGRALSSGAASLSSMWRLWWSRSIVDISSVNLSSSNLVSNSNLMSLIISRLWDSMVWK